MIRPANRGPKPVGNRTRYGASCGYYSRDPKVACVETDWLKRGECIDNIRFAIESFHAVCMVTPIPGLFNDLGTHDLPSNDASKKIRVRIAV